MAQKQPCEFLGCDPVSGQCIGFCEEAKRSEKRQAIKEMPVQFADDESYFDFPEAENEARETLSGMRGLAIAMLVSAFTVVALTGAAVFFWKY